MLSQVHYTFTLPYESKIQEGGLSIDVKLWRDATNKRSRMDSYNSSNIFIQSKVQPQYCACSLRWTCC